MNPDPFTMRELLAMAEAKSKDNWNHTSAILALIINVNRDPRKKRAVSPKEINPHEQKPKMTVRGKGLRILKDVFVDREIKLEKIEKNELQKIEQRGNVSPH